MLKDMQIIFIALIFGVGFIGVIWDLLVWITK